MSILLNPSISPLKNQESVHKNQGNATKSAENMIPDTDKLSSKKTAPSTDLENKTADSVSLTKSGKTEPGKMSAAVKPGVEMGPEEAAKALNTAIRSILQNSNNSVPAQANQQSQAALNLLKDS